MVNQEIYTPPEGSSVTHQPAGAADGQNSSLELKNADLNMNFLKLTITVRARQSRSMGWARPVKIFENRKKCKEEDNSAF